MRAVVAMAAVATTLALGFVAELASQPPSPTPSKVQQPPKAEAHSERQDAAADKRGTNDSPLVVELKNTGKSAEESEEDKRERAEKSSADWWMVKLTGVLGVLALLQFVAFVVQARYLKKTVEGAESAAKAVEDTTWIELRPYIGVEKIEFTLEGTRYQENALRATPDASILKLRIKNYGKTPGYSVSVFALVLDEIPKDEHFASYRPTFGAPVFMGQNIYPDQLHPIDLDAYRSPLAKFNGGVFYVYGKIVYYDPLRKYEWALEFCRAYMGANHFTPHGTYNNETGAPRPS